MNSILASLSIKSTHLLVPNWNMGMVLFVDKIFDSDKDNAI